MKIGYARVSTGEQNLQLQIDALKRAGCITIYQDNGISAAIRERPEFEKAIQKLERGDTLVIWKMDRAFRSLIHALQVLEDFDARGVNFHSLTDAIDTTTPMGRFAYQITNAFAEFERALIAERTKAGMDAARRRGKHIGRPRKLTPEQVADARVVLSSGGRTLPSIAENYGVSLRTLSRALDRM